MKTRFKFISAILCLLTSVLCQPLQAAGIATTHSLNSGTVAITNTQKRSSWVPVALLFRFTAPASGAITVERRTGSTAFLLTGCTLSNNQHAVWVPEADIPFNENDSLLVTSTITNGTVEIIRKGE
ncbi:MAG: hypothetical protein WC657_08855 [Candidatus Paceibacterota bacterium]|jgi:hypothetical protein